MISSPFKWLGRKLANWLSEDGPPPEFPLCDFDKLSYEIRPCDVLLFEGRSRISEIIKAVTQSPWSHAALYIGRIHDIVDPELREEIRAYVKGDDETQLIIESILGKGTIISPISNYKDDHIRICRPKGISRDDAQKVIGYCIERLGTEYDVRQIYDLFRFLYPWSLFPRRFRSTLFTWHSGAATKKICSTLLAEAFNSVKFPILPLIKKHDKKGVEFIVRNPRLYTPCHFDYSPYFEIIKYPLFELSERPLYRDLPWNENIISNDEEGFLIPEKSINPADHLPTDTTDTPDKATRSSAKKKNDKNNDNFMIEE